LYNRHWFQSGVTAQQAVARDRPSSPFFEIDFGTVRLHLSEGYVAAREPQAFEETFVLQGGWDLPKGE